jgi:hypothetical protein
MRRMRGERQAGEMEAMRLTGRGGARRSAGLSRFLRTFFWAEVAV